MITEPNEEQQKAIDGFYSFLMGSDKEMILAGPGGTGKTFTMGHMIDQVIPEYHTSCKLMGIEPEFDSVQMTATTNKASEVLSQATSRPTSTIHSFLNLKVKENYRTGQTFLTPTNNWVIHERLVLFIDECSMIDTPLYNKIQEGTKGCKIVYVGDSAQLAPVMETLSPVYRHNLPIFELKKPMRNAGQPALQALCQQLRDTVETGIFKPIQIVPGVIDWFDSLNMQQEINDIARGVPFSWRILAYTNQKVMDCNRYIRSIRGLTDEIVVGDELVSNSSVRLRGNQLSVEDQVTITKVGNKYHTPIDSDVELEVYNCNFRSKFNSWDNVAIPVDYEHYHSLVKHYARAKNWDRYFFLKQEFPDLRPSDACTVYKAQGSTVDVAYIDMSDISTCHKANQVARMLYVAVSRPRQRIVMFGDLAQKYGGIVR